MEFPSGHNRHHHRDEEDYPPPPPPSLPHHHEHNRDGEELQERYGDIRYKRPPPPPQPGFSYSEPGYPSVQHVSHEFNQGFGYERPPPPPQPQPGFSYSEPGYPSVQHVSHEPNQGFGYERPPPPPQPGFNYFEPGYPAVQHVSHELNQGFGPDPHEFHHESHQHHHHHQHNLPSFVHHHSHEGGSELSNRPSVRVFCKAETGYSLTIRDGHVILARSDQTDMFQHWVKEEKYSTRVKDEQGFPSFALVNKATGQAIKHSIGATHPVQLIPYNSNVLDESILWSESKDLGDSFRTIRMVNNIRLNLDAFNGDKNHGGVHDGTIAVLWEWKKGDNQRWKIIPYCKSFNASVKGKEMIKESPSSYYLLVNEIKVMVFYGHCRKLQIKKKIKIKKNGNLFL